MHFELPNCYRISVPPSTLAFTILEKSIEVAFHAHGPEIRNDALASFWLLPCRDAVSFRYDLVVGPSLLASIKPRGIGRVGGANN